MQLCNSKFLQFKTFISKHKTIWSAVTYDRVIHPTPQQYNHSMNTTSTWGTKEIKRKEMVQGKKKKRQKPPSNRAGGLKIPFLPVPSFSVPKFQSRNSFSFLLVPSLSQYSNPEPNGRTERTFLRNPKRTGGDADWRLRRISHFCSCAAASPPPRPLCSPRRAASSPWRRSRGVSIREALQAGAEDVPEARAALLLVLRRRQPSHGPGFATAGTGDAARCRAHTGSMETMGSSPTRIR